MSDKPTKPTCPEKETKCNPDLNLVDIHKESRSREENVVINHNETIENHNEVIVNQLNIFRGCGGGRAEIRTFRGAEAEELMGRPAVSLQAWGGGCHGGYAGIDVGPRPYYSSQRTYGGERGYSMSQSYESEYESRIFGQQRGRMDMQTEQFIDDFLSGRALPSQYYIPARAQEFDSNNEYESWDLRGDAGNAYADAQSFAPADDAYPGWSAQGPSAEDEYWMSLERRANQ